MRAYRLTRVTIRKINAIREEPGERGNIVYRMQVRCPRPASISGASASESLPLTETLRKHPAVFAENQQDASDRPFPVTSRSPGTRGKGPHG